MSLKNSWVDTSPFSKLILLGLLMTLSTLLSLGLFYTLNELTWGFSIRQLSFLNLNTDPEIIWAAKFLQMFSQLGLFILPALIFSYFISTHPFKELNLVSAPSALTMGLLFVITLLSIPFINFLSIWNAEIHFPAFLGFIEDWMREMQSKNDILMEVILQMNSQKDVLINILMMVILPAVGEELIFRGIIQKQLLQWFRNPHIAILVAATLFSAFHMQFLGFFSRLLLGIVFGYFYYYSKNLWTAITAHAVNNGLALTIVLVYGSGLESNAFSSTPDLIAIIASIIGFGIAILLLVTAYRKIQLTP
jgi:membrane protease YdiL (CAAX protease family)